MRSFGEILDVAKPELARWLASDPRVFANRVITITDDGTAVRVFSGTLAQASEAMASNGAHVASRLRARLTPDVSPVILVTQAGAVGLETFAWARALGGPSGAR